MRSAGGMDRNPAAERFFKDFLLFQLPGGTYMARLEQTVAEGKSRLVVNADDLRAFDAAQTRLFLADPLEHLPHWEAALADVVGERWPDKAVVVQVGLDGALGASHVTPRGLGSHLLRQMVMVEGIVTKASMVRPKVVRTVHYSRETNAHMHRLYRDALSLIGEPTTAVPPSRDDAGNELSWEFGLSTYKDHQAVTVQEMPERAPAGQLPRSVEVVLEHDLADTAKPGDRVQVVGVYRALPSIQGSRSKGVFRSVVLANQLRPLGKGSEQNNVLSVLDVENIERVAQAPDCFDRMARSLAPSIYGHTYVKKALLLQLLGGVEKNLPNGTHLRGDINIMMIGDPSTAKSQLVRVRSPTHGSLSHPAAVALRAQHCSTGH